MTDDRLKEIKKAFAPFAEALRVNEMDTIGHLSPDRQVLFTLSGSWSNPVKVTLGDLRRLYRVIHEKETRGSDE